MIWSAIGLSSRGPAAGGCPHKQPNAAGHDGEIQVQSERPWSKQVVERHNSHLHSGCPRLVVGVPARVRDHHSGVTAPAADRRGSPYVGGPDLPRQAESYRLTDSALGQVEQRGSGARLVEHSRSFGRPGDMWRSVFLGFVFVGVLAGCSLGGGSGAGSAQRSDVMTSQLDIGPGLPYHSVVVRGTRTFKSGELGVPLTVHCPESGRPASSR
jgi:hypothetical protein